MPPRRHGFFFDNKMLKRFTLLNWAPALIVMAVIFVASSQPSVKLPDFNWADRLVKKSAHIVGYAVLASSYWHGLEKRTDRLWLAWLLAILYAMTDEYHQSFVIGRNASIWDVLIFDNLGSLLGLWVISRLSKQNDQANAPDR